MLSNVVAAAEIIMNGEFRGQEIRQQLVPQGTCCVHIRQCKPLTLQIRNLNYGTSEQEIEALSRSQPSS
jgi:hypothetical protein